LGGKREATPRRAVHLTTGLMRKHLFVLLPFLLLAGASPAGAQADPATLPAHDSHQGLLVAVDPYVSPARCKQRFGKHNPCDGGILALEVFFRNDNDSPIRIDRSTVRMRIGPPGESRRTLHAISPEDVADRTVGGLQRGPVLRRPFPLPRPGPTSGRSKTWRQMDDVLQSLAMPTDILAPHATTHGFFYFDISHHYNWLSNASLEVPDLEFMVNHKALFFFDVNLAPAAH
jgi:hypothetical protein